MIKTLLSRKCRTNSSRIKRFCQRKTKRSKEIYLYLKTGANTKKAQKTMETKKVSEKKMWVFNCFVKKCFKLWESGGLYLPTSRGVSCQGNKTTFKSFSRQIRMRSCRRLIQFPLSLLSDPAEDWIGANVESDPDLKGQPHEIWCTINFFGIARKI
jgi:hypothetical protein